MEAKSTRLSLTDPTHISLPLTEGKPLPTEIRKDSEAIRKELPYDEAQEEMEDHVDDEYARAGIQDPKVVVTTSRDPSSRLQQFAKEMRLVIPGSQRINRGNYVMKELVQACRSNEVTDLVILHEHRGQPDGMIISHFPYGPTIHLTLYNVVLRHDIKDQGTVSEAFPHLIFNQFTSKLGQRVSVPWEGNGGLARGSGRSLYRKDLFSSISLMPTVPLFSLSSLSLSLSLDHEHPQASLPRPETRLQEGHDLC